MADKVRIFRLIEYSGDHRAVEEQVQRSLHGTRPGVKGCQITAQTIGEFPESITDDTNGELIERIADTIAAYTGPDGEVLEHPALVREIIGMLSYMPQFAIQRKPDDFI